MRNGEWGLPHKNYAPTASSHHCSSGILVIKDLSHEQKTKEQWNATYSGGPRKYNLGAKYFQRDIVA